MHAQAARLQQGHNPPCLRPDHAHRLLQVVELTDAGKDFLRRAFKRADRNRDGALSAAEQEDMWSTAPAS